MVHFASSEFWSAYDKLPVQIQKLADKNFAVLKENPQHPSLHFKKVGRYWSVRIGAHYRAVGVDAEDGIVWFWIGSHSDHDTLIQL